jgi:hypothetical protein
VILYFGSKVRNYFNKSIALGDALGNKRSNGLPALFGMDYTIFLYFSYWILFISYSLGVPITYNINSNWFFVSVPGKKGFLLRSSANMQPTAHTSTDSLYYFYESNRSGALYQRLKTKSFIILAFILTLTRERAKPKSVIYKSQLLLTKRFLGFKSLWTT